MPPSPPPKLSRFRSLLAVVSKQVAVAQLLFVSSEDASFARHRRCCLSIHRRHRSFSITHPCRLAQNSSSSKGARRMRESFHLYQRRCGRLLPQHCKTMIWLLTDNTLSCNVKPINISFPLRSESPGRFTQCRYHPQHLLQDGVSVLVEAAQVLDAQTLWIS